jgi:hypothetical protein
MDLWVPGAKVGDHYLYIFNNVLIALDGLVYWLALPCCNDCHQIIHSPFPSAHSGRARF